MIILLALELTLRASGYQPQTSATEDFTSSIHQVDSIMGWRYTPGDYQTSAPDDSSRLLQITIDANGTRATKATPAPESSPRLLLVGGSFTFGEGLSNDEAFGWKLQKQLPRWDVQNKAVGGYGTYQSLLRAESTLSESNPPEIVIYGFISHHIKRNIAHSHWLEVLNTNLGKNEIKVPYVTLGADEQLMRHAPRGLPAIPLARYSTLSHMVKRVMTRLMARSREQDDFNATLALIKTMHQRCQKQGAIFYLVVLSDPKELLQQGQAYFEAHGIKVIDCHVPLHEANTIKNDGHPNAQVHSKYAECIGQRLRADGLVSPYEVTTPGAHLP